MRKADNQPEWDVPEVWMKIVQDAGKVKGVPVSFSKWMTDEIERLVRWSEYCGIIHGALAQRRICPGVEDIDVERVTEKGMGICKKLWLIVLTQCHIVTAIETEEERWYRRAT
jgi:hypothetical protein